ncbi:MAG TPA: 3-phosphoshikimate 1-carboxyvinyltransferase, partial [bacterium]
MDRHINPVKRVRGILKVPGDKSISHRALLLGALAQGRTSIVNLSSGMDVASTLSCLSKLGVRLSSDADGRICYIEGCGGFRETEGVLDAGNSGTTIRLLSGLLAGQTFTSRITGDESLRRRPMERILVPLRKMGADIAAGLGDTVPLTIHGKPLHGIDYRIPMA